MGGVVEDGFSLQPKQQIKGWPRSGPYGFEVVFVSICCFFSIINCSLALCRIYFPFFHFLPLSFFKTEKRSFSTLLYLTCRYFLLVEGEKIEKKKIKKRPLSFCFRLCFVLIRIRNPLCLIERIRKASNSKAHKKRREHLSYRKKLRWRVAFFLFFKVIAKMEISGTHHWYRTVLHATYMV